MTLFDPHGASQDRDQAVEADLARIRRRWRQTKAAEPYPSAFFFMVQIVRTGKIPPVPHKMKTA